MRKNEVTKIIQVEKAYRLHSMASAVIPESTSLDEVVSISARDPRILGFFLVDSRRKLTGVITRIELMRWAHIKLFGGKGRNEILMADFFRIADARQARDLACGYGRKLHVKQNDSLKKALDLMLDFKIDIIPVVDTEGGILGDLHFSDVLFITLLAKEKVILEQWVK